MRYVKISSSQIFAKPQNYTGNRKLYDSPSAKQHAKSSLFSSQETVKDPYTDAELTLTIAEAKRLYGSDWQKHLAESDHILAIERIHEAHKNNPFITNENIRNAANSPDNMEVTSRAFNNAKRSRTNSEFMSERDYREEKGLRLSHEKEQRAIQVGKSAEDSTNIQLLSDTAVNVTQTFHNAGTQAAQYGGAAALTASGITNIIAVLKGEKSPGDALSDIARDGVKGAASSYFVGGGLTTLAQSLSGSSSKIIQSFMKSNVPGQIVTGVMTFGGALKRYATGEIDTREFVLEIGEGGLNFGAMSYGFAVGQSLIPVPIIGGIIGSLVGSVLTSGLIGRITENLRRKQLEHLERMRLTAELEEAARQERAFRAELESYLREWFRDYRECFTEALSGMESAFAAGDADGVIAGANAITRKLGGNVQYETVAEYRELLASNAAFVW